MTRTARRHWRWWLPQIGLLVMLALGLYAVGTNLAANMAQRGMVPSFAFLANSARFPVSESLLPYSPVDSLARAFLIGLCNNLFLTALVIILSTLLAIPVALARRSDHGLARAGAGAFIETARNTPLVVQLLFWYGVVTISLPSPRAAMQPLAGVFLTDRGIYFTALGITGSALPMVLVVSGGLVLTAVLAWRGRLHQGSVATLGTVLAGSALWVLLDLGITPDVPRLGRFNFVGGWTLTPEFIAIILGSVFYAAAFAAEIVRGGLEAVPRGQWDASRALGLTTRQSLRLVIMPQALRIMVPPMTNQFISILKNSTLALVVGYPEFNFIANTTMNHTGQVVEVIAILMLVFLLLAGGISFTMNRLDARISRRRG